MTNDLTEIDVKSSVTNSSSNETNSKPVYVFVSLGILFILTLIFIFYVTSSPDWVASTATPHDPDTEFLIDTSPQTSQNNAKIISSWILILIASFGALQIFPVLVASKKANKKHLTEKLKREILFLCETPMYLGLLGSLLGVCITQFTTGTLSAPLAYITTITGILLHLFAKFTIIVPMPTTSITAIMEEV